MTITPGGFPDINLVDNKKGLDEISKCVLLNTAETNWTIGSEGEPAKHIHVAFPPPEIPADKSVICLYRNWKFYAGGKDFDIFEKSQNLGKLVNGSFVCYTTSPGSHVYMGNFNSGVKQIASKKVDLQPGIVSYILFSPIFDGGELTFVPPAEALKEIRELKSIK